MVANKFMDKKHMDKVLQKSSYKTEEALFAAIGFGEIGAITIFNRLTEKERREEERAKATRRSRRASQRWRGQG